jgi:surface polysaccharide O-acyltransferase-like enzyme
MNYYLSLKIKILAFILIIGVVFTHAPIYETHFSNGNLIVKDHFTLFIQHFFSDGMGRASVGLFFLISGFLFYYKHLDSVGDLIPKMQKRAYTLLLPYLIWSGYGILLTALFQWLPLSRPFFTHSPVSQYTLPQLLYTWLIHPIPYQLWFLRDVIIMVALSPLFYWGIKTTGLFGLSACFLLWALSPHSSLWADDDLGALLFYSIGAWMGLKNKALYCSPGWGIVLILIWMTALALKTEWVIESGGDAQSQLLAAKITNLIGMGAIWFGYDWIYLSVNLDNKKDQLLKSGWMSLFSCFFFIYAFHEPVLTLLKKVLLYAHIQVLVAYFLAPIITMVIAVLLAEGLKKSKLSGFYYLITGNR